MTRSFRQTKQSPKHDFQIATSPPKQIKRGGAGKHSWGSEQDMFSDAQSAVLNDDAPLSISPQQAKHGFYVREEQNVKGKAPADEVQGLNNAPRHDSLSSTSSEPSTSSLSTN